jgi:V/A-type H+-transporting ATPase subunit I
VLGALRPIAGARPSAPPAASTADLARSAKLARRLRRTVQALLRRRTALDEEQALIEKYRQYFVLFAPLLRRAARLPNVAAFHLVLRAHEAEAVKRLRESLATVLGDEFELRAELLPSGELAMLLLVTAEAGARAEQMLSAARVQEIPAPAGFGGRSLAEAFPDMKQRLEQIPKELEAVQRELEHLAHEHGTELEEARSAMRDQLVRLEALPLTGATAHAFVIEGWLPAGERPRLETRLRSDCGTQVVVQELFREEGAPVVLSNPRFFRPFEVLVRLLPLPRYGSIDPTPFVGIFFPMFFGLILGDVGYGAMLAILGLALHLRSRPGSTWRDLAEVSGPCAAFSILFGFAYGEFFGDLGRRWFGLRPLVFDREEAVIPFLILAVAIGLVHVLLGLVLGIVNERSHPRLAAGRGLAALMVVFITLALLAALRVLPPAIFPPSVVAVLVLFPVLVAVEGVLAAVELLSIVGNVLSYARIMALGTASVMLAIVANQMAGALGSAIVGAVFALLFHLVNFALGLFSPTIHALRLHYVEFFSKFYRPGGTRHQPFGHWTPDATA